MALHGQMSTELPTIKLLGKEYTTDQFMTPGGPQPAAAQPEAAPPPEMIQPSAILSNQLEDLQNTFRQREQTLRGYKLKPKEHNKYVKQLQQEYDDAKFQIGMIKSTFDVLTQAVASGKLDEEDANRAMYSLVLPKEAVEALYPKVPQRETIRRPFSASMLTDFEEAAQEYADAAPLERKGPNHYPQEGLLKQYLEYRAYTGYDVLNPTEQRQLDHAWDGVMGDNQKFRWDPSSKDVQALRSYGSKLKEQMGAKVSPFARSFQTTTKVKKSAPKPAPAQTSDPLGLGL